MILANGVVKALGHVQRTLVHVLARAALVLEARPANALVPGRRNLAEAALAAWFAVATPQNWRVVRHAL